MKKPFLIIVLTTLLTMAFNSRSNGGKHDADTPVEPATTDAQTSSLPALDTLRKRLHWYGQASFRLDGPPKIYFDPVFNLKEEPVRADIILISHNHRDHYSPATLKLISSQETVIITSHPVSMLLKQDGVPGVVHPLLPSESRRVGGVEVEAVPAYNVDKKYHPKEAGGLGFIITLDKLRVYFAGDTDFIPEMAEIHPDVALIPIGGTYTMDVAQALEAVAALTPQVVVPMHILAEANLAAFQKLCKCKMWIMEMEA